MLLTKRFNKLIELIKYKSIVDVACDHGYISIGAIKSGKVNKVIATDLNEKPLNKCRQNSHQYGYSYIMDIRLGSGLSTVKENEVDTAIVAGLGGNLMCKILNDDIDITKSIKQLILQPQSEINLVRRFLDENGYMFIEHYVEDKNKFYVVLDCEKKENDTKLSEYELIYGKNINIDNEYIIYLNHMLDKNAKILNKLNKNTDKYQEIKQSILVYEEKIANATSKGNS